MASRKRVPVPVALRFAYDGRRFDGYARQPKGHTVEGALLKALVEVGAIPDPAECGYRPGSRTDRGVSARENTVAFRSLVPPQRLAGALVGRVQGLWPLSALAVAPGFDPRRARWREYRYFLPARALPKGVTRARLSQVFSVFVGRHDFSAFSRREAHRASVREILLVDVQGPDAQEVFVVRVRGASFLWQQVRRMIGAAVAVCREEAQLDEVRAFLGGEGEVAPWGPAPADPLVLWRVYDPRLVFPPPGRWAEKLSEEWVSNWGEAVARVRFLESLFEDSDSSGARIG